MEASIADYLLGVEPMFRSTREVADLLGVTPGRISKAVWDGRLTPPQRGPSGAFLWTEQDIQQAAWVLLGRNVDAVLAEREAAEVEKGGYR